MLVISRSAGQKIQIGQGITVTFLKSRGTGMRVGIEAPPGTSVHRHEVWEKARELMRAVKNPADDDVKELKNRLSSDDKIPENGLTNPGLPFCAEQGLWGFHDTREFFLETLRNAGGLFCLRGAEGPDCRFLLLDTSGRLPEFSVAPETLVRETGWNLDPGEIGSVKILVPVCVPRGRAEGACACLRIPLAVHLEENIACQLLLGGSEPWKKAIFTNGLQ